MRRGWTLAVVVLLAVVANAAAQEPAKKGVKTTFVVQCKFSRAALETDDQGRVTLERSSVTLPDITTLEGTKGEYVTERKIQAGLYQTRLQVQVQRISETKIQVEVLAEDVWSEGARDQPTIHRRGLQTTRQLNLGDKLKFALEERNEKGQGVWVELTVKEEE